MQLFSEENCLLTFSSDCRRNNTGKIPAQQLKELYCLLSVEYSFNRIGNRANSARRCAIFRKKTCSIFPRLTALGLLCFRRIHVGWGFYERMAAGKCDAIGFVVLFLHLFWVVINLQINALWLDFMTLCYRNFVYRHQVGAPGTTWRAWENWSKFDVPYLSSSWLAMSVGTRDLDGALDRVVFACGKL